jgi:hypothetical protein
MTVAPVDHGSELVPVDQLADGCSTVAHELRDLLDRDAASESTGTNECRSSRGVH